MWYVIIAILAFAGGAIGMFFFMRNNKKYFNIDDMLKLERDKLLELGRDKLAELKKKIEEILSGII
jgi:hypothetical protein